MLWPPPLTKRRQEAYSAAAGRFSALQKALLLGNLPGYVRDAVGTIEFNLATIASSRAREPTVFFKGIALPLALSPPPAPKWWRGEGQGTCGGSGDACLAQGPGGTRALKARSVHARCPGWWRSGDAVTCSGALWGKADVSLKP